MYTHRIERVSAASIASNAVVNTRLGSTMKANVHA